MLRRRPAPARTAAAARRREDEGHACGLRPAASCGHGDASGAGSITEAYHAQGCQRQPKDLARELLAYLEEAGCLDAPPGV